MNLYFLYRTNTGIMTGNPRLIYGKDDIVCCCFRYETVSCFMLNGNYRLVILVTKEIDGLEIP
jgi:hypothetical protein